MSSYNNFKSTTIRGLFQNSDYPNNSILADGIFDRNLTIKQNLLLGNETPQTDPSGNIIGYTDTFEYIRLKDNGINKDITKTDLLKLKNNLATENYVNTAIGDLISATPEIIESLQELEDQIANNQNIIDSLNAQIALKANINNPTFTGTVSGITKDMIGLNNVDNTSDINKPISTATQTALNLKANVNNPVFTGTLITTAIT